MVSMFEVAEDDSHAPQSEACAAGPRNGYALYEVDQKDWTLPNLAVGVYPGSGVRGLIGVGDGC